MFDAGEDEERRKIGRLACTSTAARIRPEVTSSYIYMYSFTPIGEAVNRTRTDRRPRRRLIVTPGVGREEMTGKCSDPEGLESVMWIVDLTNHGRHL
jgi:hypothetical protein